MHVQRLHPPRKAFAKQTLQVGQCEVEERRLALHFQLGRQAAAEIDFDQRPSERTELIGRRSGAVDAAEGARIGIELVGAVERQKQFIGKAERQPARGLGFFPAAPARTGIPCRR